MTSLSRVQEILHRLCAFDTTSRDSNLPLIDTATREQMQQRTDWGDLLDDNRAPATNRLPEKASLND